MVQGREGDVVLDDDVVQPLPVHERYLFNHNRVFIS
jgi:hypothetical protein